MIKILFPTLPRQYGIKRLVVKDWDTIFHLVNKWNGKIDQYLSIYEYNADDPNKTLIDKIYFDLDSPNCWEKVKQAHKDLMKMNLKHYIQFTGRGFGLFIFTNRGWLLQYPKACLENAQKHLAKELNLTIGKHDIADIDEHIIGDIRRITRIPNTFNIKPTARRFCIPIVEADFKRTFDEIKSLAKVQRFIKPKKCIFGTTLFNIKQFDTTPDLNIVYLDDIDFKTDKVDIKFLEGKIPPLIINMLLTQKCGWKDRYYTILAFKEAGFPMPLCIEYCKKNWLPQKFTHALKDERQFQYIYGRGNLFFPNWEFLKVEGYPVTKKDMKFLFYKKGGKV